MSGICSARRLLQRSDRSFANKNLVNAVPIHIDHFKTESILLKLSPLLRNITEMMENIAADGLVSVGFQFSWRQNQSNSLCCLFEIKLGKRP